MDIIWEEEFDHQIRHTSFCGNTTTTDNMAVVDAYAHHEGSMAKFRIRMKDSEVSTDPSDALNWAYFGVRELFIRVGSCPRHCLECSSPKFCKKCEAPYTATTNGSCMCDSTLGFDDGYGCLANCDPDEFYSSSEKECIPCDDQFQNCQTCTANECLRCEPGFFFDDEDDKCVDFCPSGYRESKNISFYLGGTLEERDACVACPNNCSTCTMNGSCIFCKSGYRFYQGECLEDCPVGYTSRWSECVKCPYQCEYCLHEHFCELCKEGYEEVAGDCVPFCPGTHDVAAESTNNCGVTCHDNCLTCFGTLSNQCVTCPSGSFKYQDTCLANCSISTLPGLFTENGHCVHCPQ